MKRIRFGRTGQDVSAVALGTWGHGGPNEVGGASVGWSGHDDTQAVEAIYRAFEAGIDHWDTADVYGNGHAETLIGKVFDDIDRSKVFLATKVGYDYGGHEHAYDPRLIRDRLERSLENLQTDFVDLYYFHHCDFGPGDRQLDRALEEMRHLQQRGLFRYLGLSDWSASNIMRVIDRIRPDVVQPYRNVIDDDYAASGLKRYVDEHDLGVAFFSPLKHGLLLGKYEEATSFPAGDFRRGIPEFSDQKAIDRMRSAASAMRERFRDHREPVLHALVGALLADSPTGSVLLGQRNPRHVEAAATLGAALSLEDAEWVRSRYRGE